MTKQINKKSTLSNKDRTILIISSVIMVGTIPFTYVFFFLPLLALPIVLLAILVLIGVIRNSMAIRVVEVLSVFGAISALWLVGVLLNYLRA